MKILDLPIEELHALETISRHCPQALKTYIQCICRVSEEGTVYFSREDVDINMSEEWEEFRANIKKLALEDLLEWHPIDDGISVTLAELYVEDQEEVL